MDPSARDNTYKSFQLWLEAKFANGVPSIHELEAISNELAPPWSTRLLRSYLQILHFTGMRTRDNVPICITIHLTPICITIHHITISHNSSYHYLSQFIISLFITIHHITIYHNSSYHYLSQFIISLFIPVIHVPNFDCMYVFIHSSLLSKFDGDYIFVMIHV